MFSSRRTSTKAHKFRQAVWPEMGVRRTMRYWRHRIVRLKDSDFAIAAGFAFGAAISFTPLPGAHVLGTVALCFLFRCNIISGILGTLVGNPWTIPPMWWISYLAGKWAFIEMGFRVRRMPGHFEWDQMVAEITHDPMRLIAPWVTGGFMMMAFSWPIFYLLARGVLVHLRSTHHMWKENRLHRVARSITGQAE